MAFFRVKIPWKWVNIPFFRCSKILGEAGKQEILQHMPRKFQISNRLPNRYFPENCRWVPLIRSAENKAQVKWLTAKCYPYFIHNCSLETIKNANIAFFLVSSFWCEEWYLEKCGSRKILARSRISELAFDGSQVSFSGDFCVSPVPIFVIVVVVFCRRVLESRICRFFFPFSIQEKNFSEFMGTAYRSESSILMGLSS